MTPGRVESAEAFDDPGEDRYVVVGRCRSTGKEVSLCYHTFGDPSAPPLLLIQGLGTSLLGFPHAFIGLLVKVGYYVIRYDHRDVGRSTHFVEFAPPALLRYGLPAWASLGERVPYTLVDMMEDAVGLLTALRLAQAHVFGLSMGGMIAQLLAIHHPSRVRSLTLLFTHMGGADAVEPGIFTHLRFLRRPRSTGVEDRIDHMRWYIAFLSQHQYPRDAEALGRFLRATFARESASDLGGQDRQIAALMRATGRRAALRRLQVPTTVLHGALDPLIPLENAYRLAETIPGAKLVVFPRLGHDFPPALYPSIADELILTMRLGDGAGLPCRRTDERSGAGKSGAESSL